MVQWHSPDTDAAVKLNDLKGRKYDVIVYYEPPFVIISGGDAKPINGKPNDPVRANGACVDLRGIFYFDMSHSTSHDRLTLILFDL